MAEAPLGDKNQRIAATPDDPVEMDAAPQEAATDAGSLRPASPGLDSLADELMRQRIHASLFASEQAGVWVDRFELLEELGAGGMGTVWRARDHRLQREVALKFLRSGLDGEAGEQRLFREAQALARLRHPNVITVHDVGREDGRVWIAMERVPGRTLRAWVSEDRPSAEEILAVWIAAGRGLAAVHAAGLIHRDVKPDNLLLDEGGRAQVIDFGLVRAVEAAREVVTEPEAGAGGDTDRVSQLVTRTAQFVGTPAYAAPEQRAGASVDARADQYAFCVGLWEALTGARPSVEAKPKAGELPIRVRAALLRGLEAAPEDRFASMEELLAALEPRRRAWLWPAALGLALLGAAAAGVWSTDDGGAVEEPCAEIAGELDGVWDREREAELVSSFEATGLPWAASTARRVGVELEGWREEWIAERRELCEERVAGEGERGSLARRDDCLELRRRGLEALVHGLADAEPRTVARAVDAARELPRPRTCRDEALLATGLEPPPAELADRVASLRAELAEVEAALLTGKLDAASIRAAELRDAAEALGYAPLDAEARYLFGLVTITAGDLEAGLAALEEAVDLAEASRHDRISAEGWRHLASRSAVDLRDLERSRRAARRMRAAYERVETLMPARGERALVDGQLALLDGRPADAEDALRRAVEDFEARGEHSKLGATRGALAGALERQGRGEEALVEYRRAREQAEQAYGPAHPEVAARAHDLGLALAERGEAEDARRELERAVEIWTTVPDEDHPELAHAHILLASFAFERGELEAAEAELEAAAATYAELMPESGSERAELDANLAVLRYARGDHAGALEAFDAALAHFRAERGADDALVVQIEINRAWALFALDRLDEAQAALEQARARLPADLRPDHARVGLALAAVAFERGELEACRRELEELGDLREALDPGSRAELAVLDALVAMRRGGPAEPLELEADARSGARSFAELLDTPEAELTALGL